MKRTQARELLMQLVFEMQAQKDKSEFMIRRFADEAIGDDEQREYFDRACKAYVDNAEEIDRIIEENANGWKLSRLARVDLAILRLAVAEMKYLDEEDVPDAAAINEAVELAKKYGDESSARFVNGLLGKVSRL
ncbi:MAG: transcription antitermination factor NusB [Firmicutes bacterium]|nr:transcription antitermination factor NusB [Bacillota bacterium]